MRTLRSLVALLLAIPLAAPAAAGQSAPAAAVDLKGISRGLESLTERISPAVVQIFAVGYVLPEDETEDRSLLDQPAQHRLGRHRRSRRLHRHQRARRPGRAPGPGAGAVAAPAKRQHSVAAAAAAAGRGAQVVAIDEETDLAVLKVDEKGLPVAARSPTPTRCGPASSCSPSAARSVSTAR